MRLRLRENFNIVVNRVVRELAAKIKVKRKMQTHSVNEPLGLNIYYLNVFATHSQLCVTLPF